MTHRHPGGKHPSNLRARSKEQGAPKARPQAEEKRGRSKRAPEHMRQSGMAK